MTLRKLRKWSCKGEIVVAADSNFSIKEKLWRAVLAGGSLIQLREHLIKLEPLQGILDTRSILKWGKNSEGINAGPRNRGTRNLPYQKYLRRREAKLCYRCEGPFAAGHKCPEKNLRLIILAEDEVVNEEGELVCLEAKRNKEVEGEMEQ